MRNGPRGHAGESGEPASFKGAGLEVFNKAQMMAGATVNFAFTDSMCPVKQHSSLHEPCETSQRRDAGWP
jgi:hypothetical protein